MNERNVVITGVGPVASIGIGADSFWEALAAGRSSAEVRSLPVEPFESVELPVASMPDAATVAGLDRHFARLTELECGPCRDLAYTMLAVELALADAGLAPGDVAETCGLIQVFEAPSVEQTVAQLFEMMKRPPPTNGPPKVYEALSPSFYAMQPFFYVHILSKAFGLHGFSTSVHNACSSGAFALETAADRIRSGQASAMIVAGGEAFDTAVRLEWFRRLDLYAMDGNMKPFDPESSGFYVGEGGGAIVLESEQHARQRGATVYANYGGGGFSQQSWKQVIPDVRAARLATAITRAMELAEISPADVDLVVPHGASTSLSDGYEAACLTRAFEGKKSEGVATVIKPNVGHMLAASGVIETIGLLLAIKHQRVPGTLGSDPARSKLPVPLIASTTDKPIKTAMKLSTGFTGHDTAIIFKAPKPG